MHQNRIPSKRPWYFLLLLVLAGESVFILPFVLARIFRPTVLQTFQIDNLQLGLCFSFYGIVALLSYVVGGPIADRYPPRKLMAISLWLTALGGLFYATFPPYGTLRYLYGYWGFTTIFLFWAPMIKATRVWGGTTSQGKAFGILDGGRGLVGAVIGTLGVYLFSSLLPFDSTELSITESRTAFRSVILVTSVIIAAVGVLTWFYLRLEKKVEEIIVVRRISTLQIKEVMRLPSVWLLMIMILCAYVGYKVTDVFSLYAQDVMLYDQVDSARVGTALLFVRPLIGILIGFIADRSRITLWLLISFSVSYLGALIFALGLVTDGRTFLFFLSIFITASGVYAARALYFAVMEKGRIPLILTGTAVGMISVVGYTPDIFAGPAMGYLLDQSPGIIGLRHVFWMVTGFSLVGGVAALIYHAKYGKVDV